MPDRRALQQWLRGAHAAYLAAVREAEDTLTGTERQRRLEEIRHTIVIQLAQMRRAGQDMTWSSDIWLLLAREIEVKLPALGWAWSRSNNPEYAHAPHKRLGKLQDHHGTSEELLRRYEQLAAELPVRWP